MRLLTKSSRSVYLHNGRVIKLETHTKPSTWQNYNEYTFFKKIKLTKFADWVPDVYSLSEDYQLLETEFIDTPITEFDFELIKKSKFFEYCVKEGLHVKDLLMQDAWRKQGNQYKLVDAGCLECEFSKLKVA